MPTCVAPLNTPSVAVEPSGMEKRTAAVLVLAGAIHCTNDPLLGSLTARRPDASPAMSPIVRFGPTMTAPLPGVPSSASYMSYGMLAPRPTTNVAVVVLLACLTGASLA